MTVRRRAARAVPGALAALLLLTGCGQLTPGTASVVDGARITDEQVNSLADAQCTAAENAVAAGAQSSTTPLSRLKWQSLGLLMDIELNLQFAEDEGLEPEREFVDAFYGQIEPNIEALSGETRAELREVFKRWARGRAALVDAGSEATGQDATFGNAEQLLNAGLEARNAWLQDVEITTDPRYAPNEEGFPGGGDGSVSRADSDFATGAGGAEGDPSPEWISGLPADQKCG